MWIFSPLAQKLRPPWRENLQTPDSVVSIIYISCCIRYTLCIFSDMDDSYCDCAFSAFRWRKAHGALGWDYFAASLTILRPATPELLSFSFFLSFFFFFFISLFFIFLLLILFLFSSLSLSVCTSLSISFFLLFLSLFSFYFWCAHLYIFFVFNFYLS